MKLRTEVNCPSCGGCNGLFVEPNLSGYIEPFLVHCGLEDCNALMVVKGQVSAINMTVSGLDFSEFEEVHYVG